MCYALSQLHQLKNSLRNVRSLSYDISLLPGRTICIRHFVLFNSLPLIVKTEIRTIQNRALKICVVKYFLKIYVIFERREIIKIYNYV